MTGAAPLSYYDLLTATVLVIAAGVISILFRLRLEGRLAVASIRTAPPPWPWVELPPPPLPGCVGALVSP